MAFEGRRGKSRKTKMSEAARPLFCRLLRCSNFVTTPQERKAFQDHVILWFPLQLTWWS